MRCVVAQSGEETPAKDDVTDAHTDATADERSSDSPPSHAEAVDPAQSSPTAEDTTSGDSAVGVPAEVKKKVKQVKVMNGSDYSLRWATTMPQPRDEATERRLRRQERGGHHGQGAHGHVEAQYDDAAHKEETEKAAKALGYQPESQVGRLIQQVGRRSHFGLPHSAINCHRQQILTLPSSHATDTGFRARGGRAQRGAAAEAGAARAAAAQAIPSEAAAAMGTCLDPELARGVSRRRWARRDRSAVPRALRQARW